MIEIWEGYMAIMHVLTNPVLSLQPDITGRNGKKLVREVSQEQVSVNTDVCLCDSAHTSGCVVDGLGTVVVYGVLFFVELRAILWASQPYHISK